MFLGYVSFAMIWLWQSQSATTSCSDASLIWATWGLFWGTAALALFALCGLLWSIRDSKSKDGAELQRRKCETLDRFIDRFNSPPMLIARAELAKQCLGNQRTSMSGIERVPSSGHRFKFDVPPQTWTILDFFERLARYWKNNFFDTEQLDYAFSDYILVLYGEFEAEMSPEPKYVALNELVSFLLRRHEHASGTPGMDKLSSGWEKARRRFWYGEYKLFRLFPGSLPSLGEQQGSGA